MPSVRVRTFGLMGAGGSRLNPDRPIALPFRYRHKWIARSGHGGAARQCDGGAGRVLISLSSKLNVRVHSAADRGAAGLPLAVAVLAAVGALPPEPLASCAIFGALEPDGTVADCKGIAAAEIQALAHDLALMRPDGNAQVAERGTVYRVGSLLAAINHFRGTQRACLASGLAETAGTWPPEHEPMPVSVRTTNPEETGGIGSHPLSDCQPSRRGARTWRRSASVCGWAVWLRGLARH